MAYEVKVSKATRTPPIKIKFDPYLVNVDSNGGLVLTACVETEEKRQAAFVKGMKEWEDLLIPLKGELNSMFKMDGDKGANVTEEGKDIYDKPTSRLLISFKGGTKDKPQTPKCFDAKGNEIDAGEISKGDTVVVHFALRSYEDMSIATTELVLKEGNVYKKEKTPRLAKGFTKYMNKIVLVEKGEIGGSVTEEINWEDE